jgi:hypothetical protein
MVHHELDHYRHRDQLEVHPGASTTSQDGQRAGHQQTPFPEVAIAEQRAMDAASKSN